MGLFNGYLKEGPGIDKNAKKKKGFFLYIDILFRKFFNLLKTNCLYVLFSIPFIAVIFLFTAPHIIGCLGVTSEDLTKFATEYANGLLQEESITAAQLPNTILQATGMYQLQIISLITIILFNFFGAGPVSAAYAYATRCYTKGEHTWILSDGKDQFKENFKNSMLLFIFNIVMLYIIFTAFYFYGQIQLQGDAMSQIAIFARPFTLVIVFVLAIMNMFANQIMVTYECKFKDIIKNSAIIALAKLPMCVILMAIAGVVINFICTSIPDVLISVIVYMLLGLLFTRFPIEFYATRVLEKNMKNLKKRERKNAAKITYVDETAGEANEDDKEDEE